MPITMGVNALRPGIFVCVLTCGKWSCGPTVVQSECRARVLGVGFKIRRFQLAEGNEIHVTSDKNRNLSEHCSSQLSVCFWLLGDPSGQWS